MYNASLNIAIGEYILSCFPEASVQRSERGTFEKIEIVHDGILYTFKESGKTGRMKYSARPISEPLSPFDLLGITEKQYNRLCNIGTTEKPEAATTKTGDDTKAEALKNNGGRIRVYREGNDMLVTNRDFHEPATLHSRHKDVGAALSYIKKQFPDKDIFFDTAMRMELINHYGARMFQKETQPPMFYGDEYAVVSTETPALQQEHDKRRIPYGMFCHITEKYLEYITGIATENPTKAIEQLSSDIDDTEENSIFSKPYIKKAMFQEDETIHKEVAALAVMSHYINRWVQLHPHKWTFIAMTNIIDKAKAIKRKLSTINTAA